MEMVSFTPRELLGTLTDVELKNAPPMLYLLGDETLLRSVPRVSIVGSRKASPAGLERAADYARALAEGGVIVVSGLAEGIDTAAHEATMAVEGGRTIAVLGTALDTAYPAKNRPLQERIAREHLLVSQFPIGRPIQKKQFPMRNRTMALLTDATIIVEAGESSGTLHQGWEALRLGRLLFFNESVAEDPTLKWPAEMIRYGAQVLALDNLEQLVYELPRVASVGDVAF